MIYESDIIGEVYDHIFANRTLADFCGDFPASWVDHDNATIYLAKELNEPLFKIKIERV